MSALFMGLSFLDPVEVEVLPSLGQNGKDSTAGEALARQMLGQGGTPSMGMKAGPALRRLAGGTEVVLGDDGQRRLDRVRSGAPFLQLRLEAQPAFGAPLQPLLHEREGGLLIVEIAVAGEAVEGLPDLLGR